jgi:hypothetical protein
MRLTLLGAGAIALALAGLAPRAARAQGTLGGQVLDAHTSRPVAGAEIRIVARGVELVTDGQGRFRFAPLAAGTLVVDVRHLAYAPRSDTVRLADGDEVRLEIRLAADAIALPPLAVETFSMRLDEAGFFRRRARGIGTFMTREEVQAHRATHLGDLFARVPGLRRVILADGTSRIDSRGGKPPISRCDTQYFIDGVRADIAGVGVDAIPVHVVEGIEVYRSGSQVPTQFDHGRAMCGAVVIWTRGR